MQAPPSKLKVISFHECHPYQYRIGPKWTVEMLLVRVQLETEFSKRDFAIKFKTLV